MSTTRYVYAAVILLFSGCLSCGGSHGENQPDIILVTIDTLRADYPGCYGNPYIHTPELDYISRRGSLFSETVSSVPITLPSHCTIMTGLYPPEHGVRNNGLYRLDAGHSTLAESLKQDGYETGAVVGAMVLGSVFGIGQGFDEFDDYAFQVQETSDPLATYYPERKASTVNTCFFNLRGETRKQNTAYFYWIHYFDPHSPYNPPEPFRSLYPDDLYMGEIAYTDRMLGELFHKITKSDRDIFWIITSDHGEGLGAHNESTHATFIYDTTIMVPLIFSWDKHVPSGHVYQSQVQLADIYPTVLGMVGKQKPAAADGVDLSAMFKGGSTVSRKCYIESFQPWLEFGWSPLRGFRTEKEKYIEAPVPELYDIDTDPRELVSVSAGNGDRVKLLQKELVSKYGDDLQIRVAADMETSGKVLDNLKALGYLMGDRYLQETGQEKPHIDPKDRADLLNTYLLAGEMMRAGNLSKAQSLYESVVKHDSGNAFTRVALGTLYLQQSKFKDGEQQLKEAVRIRPEYSSAQVNLGLCWKFMGDTNKALEQFKQVVARFPEDENGYINLAAMYSEQNDKNAVFDVYRQWQKRMPDNPKSYLEMAKAHLQFSEPDAALAACDKAIDIFPGYASAYRVRGQVHYILKNSELTEKDFYRAFELDPENMRTIRQLVEYLFASQQFPNAVQVLEKALESHPVDLDLLINYGIALAQTGRSNEARTEFNRARDLFPENAWPLYNLGYLSLHENEPRTAEEYFLQAIKKDPQNIKAHGMLGVLYFKANDLIKSRREFELVLEIDPGNPAAKHYLAQIKELQ